MKKTLGNVAPNQQQQVKIDLKQTTAIKCEECENEIFMQAMKFRKVPKLMAGAQEDQILPVQVFICTACGHINKEFDFNV